LDGVQGVGQVVGAGWKMANKIGAMGGQIKLFFKRPDRQKPIILLKCTVCLPLTPFFPTERKGSHSTIVHVFFVCFYYDDQLLRVACLTGVDGPVVNDFSGHPQGPEF
jgi:hypothetical protein